MNQLNVKGLLNEYLIDDSNEADGDNGSGSRYRSPTFGEEEVKVLVDLIDKYKNVILNKSITATANHAKDIAWAKIAKEFNSQGLSYVRNADSLRTKWENLKKEAKKISRKVIDIKCDFSSINTRVVSMLSEGQNISGSLELDAELNGIEYEEATNIDKESSMNVFEDKESDDSGGEDENDRKKRALNFLPVECNLLLKCVRQEKKYVCNTETSCKANRLKSRAWLRITESFNKQSPRKRSPRVLRTKFENMKRLSNKVNRYLKDTSMKKYHKINGGSQSIKSEPLFEDQIDMESQRESYNNIHMRTDDNDDKFVPDPLATVLNCDSGTGSINGMDIWNQSENKEVVKLKLELLNYQLETARLEREMLENSMKADATDSKWKAIERSMRLRTARLHTVAAEMKLPPMHPALQYNTEEAKAQQYICQYQNT